LSGIDIALWDIAVELLETIPGLWRLSVEQSYLDAPPERPQLRWPADPSEFGAFSIARLWPHLDQ
jgi:hypothetical protein